MAGPTIEEVNYFKGISTHPNSISVGSGTFRNILNGWILRDGVIDMRPGFDVDATTPRAPGLSLIPGTTSPSFAGIKTIGTNTFVENDGRMFWFEPNGVANSGMVAISAGDSVNTNSVCCVAVSSEYIVFGLNANTNSPAMLVLDRTTGELIASLSNTTGTIVGVAIDELTNTIWWCDRDANKVYGGTVNATGGITTTHTIGSGSTGLSSGSPLTSVNIQAPLGLTVMNTGSVLHIYLIGQMFVYDANVTTNTGALIAGSNSSGYTNATGAAARFHTPGAIGYFNSDLTKLYVADIFNNAIRLVTTAGVVTTFAGSLSGTPGFGDGIGTAALFSAPTGLTCVSATGTTPAGSPYNGLTEDTLFVADTSNEAIRNIQQSSGTVATLAGIHGTQGTQDGTCITATFYAPFAVAASTDGQNSGIAQLLVADGFNVAPSPTVRAIDAHDPIIANNGTPGSSNGSNAMVVSTFAGGNFGTGVTHPPTALQLRLGNAGGIYNYSAITPATTAAAGTTYNPAMRLFGYDGTTYFNSTRGVMAMDLPSTYTKSQIGHFAGAPQGYDLVLTLVGSPGTLLAADHAAAYRIVWGYRTASGRPILGAPSSRFVVTNPSGAGTAKNVQAVSQIPIGVDTTWSYQLYRTSTIATALSTIDPGDTMFLVYEANLTTTDLRSGTITITDATPDGALGQDLYTNAQQETLSQSNTQPPICLDQCLFGDSDMAIYANTINKQRMFINLVGVTGFSGAPTITFTFADGLNNFTITGNSTTAADGVFVYTTGGTVGANLDATARSIVLTINQYTLNRRLRAFYVSPYDGTPGQIAIEENFVGGQSWTVTTVSAISSMFAPVIPTTGTGYAAIPDVSPNGLYCAKIQNPDAVPLVNKFTVGDSSESIRRVLPLRESVMVIKERSVWRLTGTTPDTVNITLLDNTVSLRADESCAILNNEVYALTTQGVVAISDNGVRIVARPVEYQLDEIYGTLAAPGDLNGLVTACGSDDYRTFFLSSFKTTSNFAWSYNVFTSAWTCWDLILQAITVRNGRIIGAVLQPTGANAFEANTPQVLQQLNQELFENPNAYHDAGGNWTVLSIAGSVITVAATGLTVGRWQYPFVATPTVGWIIGQGIITADDGAGNLTISDTTGLTVNGIATALRPINFTMTSNPHGGGATFKLKQWGDFFICLENQNLLNLTAGFKTNAQPETTAFAAQLKSVAQTNSVPTSAPYYKEQVFKVSIPKAQAGGNLLQWQLTINQANALVALKAVGIETRGIDSAKGQQ